MVLQLSKWGSPSQTRLSTHAALRFKRTRLSTPLTEHCRQSSSRGFGEYLTAVPSLSCLLSFPFFADSFSHILKMNLQESRRRSLRERGTQQTGIDPRIRNKSARRRRRLARDSQYFYITYSPRRSSFCPPIRY
jgi:hypothetical protein